MPPLRRHRATRDERAMGQDRVVWKSFHTRRTSEDPAGEQACTRGPAQMGTMTGVHRGARRVVHHPSAPERRRASRSSWPGPSLGRFSARIAAARPRASMFADYPRRGQASPLQLFTPKGEEHSPPSDRSQSGQRFRSSNFRRFNCYGRFATRSISTSAPTASAVTPTVVRAGRCPSAQKPGHSALSPA